MTNKLRLGSSPTLRGIRCVLADADIAKGEIVEEAPVIIIPKNEMKYINNTTLTHYEFIWNEKTGEDAIVMGYGMVYNHSFEPNIEFYPDYERKVMIFVALRDIKKGEELCSNYQQGDDPKKIPQEYLNFKY